MNSKFVSVRLAGVVHCPRSFWHKFSLIVCTSWCCFLQEENEISGRLKKFWRKNINCPHNHRGRKNLLKNTNDVAYQNCVCSAREFVSLYTCLRIRKNLVNKEPKI